MAPVPLKRKRDTSNEPKTDPMKRAYMLVPGEAKLWFVEIHAYQARVHGKSLACNIRWAKDLVPELFGPRTSLMPSRPGSASASPLGSTSTAVCCASSASNSSPADIGHRLSMKRRPIECAFMDQSFRASTTQDAFLDMIDAIDADMNAQPLDQAYMRAFKNSIRSEVAKHFAEFFLEAESNFERVNLDSSTSVLRQLQTARSIEPLAGASSIGRRWSSVSFSPDAEAEARDSEPEAHVMEPLADDHSSDSDDAPTGIEEVFVVTLFLNSLTMCAAVSEEAASDILVGRSHASGAGLVRDTRAANWSTQPQPGYELGVTSARVHARVNRVVVVCCCTFFASSIACTQNRVK